MRVNVVNVGIGREREKEGGLMLLIPFPGPRAGLSVSFFPVSLLADNSRLMSFNLRFMTEEAHIQGLASLLMVTRFTVGQPFVRHQILNFLSNPRVIPYGRHTDGQHPFHCWSVLMCTSCRHVSE